MSAKSHGAGPVYKPDELAKLLRVGAGVIRAMCQSGKLKAFRVGAKHWRIAESEVKRNYPELFGADGPAA